MSKISPLMSSVGKVASNIANSAGEKISKIALKSPETFDRFKKIAKNTEFTGFNYSFAGLSTIMFVVVLFKRLKTVFTRKTDDKKAMMDEFKEILFRDLQTILLMLFALNGIRSIASAKKSKSLGLPLNNMPFDKVFETQEGGIKGLAKKSQEFLSHPIEKIKKIGINFGKAFNPLGGVSSLNDNEIISRYSGFNDIKGVQKMFNGIEYNEGDKEKVFHTMITDIKSGVQKTIEEAKKDALLTNQCSLNGKAINTPNTRIKGASEVLSAIEKLEEQGTQGLEEIAQKADTDKTAHNVSSMILEYLNDKANPLVMQGRKNNAVLSTAALGMEAGYLGFGLPLLYKKTLKDKYLKEDPNTNKPYEEAPKVNTSLLLINKQISFKENRLYRNFSK